VDRGYSVPKTSVFIAEGAWNLVKIDVKFHVLYSQPFLMFIPLIRTDYTAFPWKLGRFLRNDRQRSLCLLVGPTWYMVMVLLCK